MINYFIKISNSFFPDSVYRKFQHLTNFLYFFGNNLTFQRFLQGGSLFLHCSNYKEQTSR